jgi:hypothetical protein
MKLLKSNCGKVWLFDCAFEDGMLNVGLACFLPGSPAICEIDAKTKVLAIELPAKAVEKPMPTRIVNARLPLLLDRCP